MKVILVILKNGLTVIGCIEAEDHTPPSLWEEYALYAPYEVLVTPSERSTNANVTLMKFGSLYGVLEGLEILTIDGNILGTMLPPASMQEQYLKIINIQ